MVEGDQQLLDILKNSFLNQLIYDNDDLDSNATFDTLDFII